MYDTGRCAPRDKAEAAKWYRKAAEQGHAKAADALANLRQAEIDLREGMDKVIGSWNCRTTNPNGLVSGETWTFGADRSFRFTDDTDTVLYGTYAQSGKNVTITIAKAERHLASMPTHQVIRADIISSSRGSRISMDTTTERGVKRKSTCTRI
jgi:TPR repeat protein